MTDVLRREIVLACSPERAFRAFTEHVDLWWPRGHRKSPGHVMRFTPDALIQTAADGSEWTMGRVIAFEASARLELDWFAGSQNDPTHVEVTFSADGSGTRVIVVHRPLTAETIGLWPRRVPMFSGGWDAVLGDLKQHIEGGSNG